MLQVFFKEILLPLVEAPGSSFEHKWLAVQALTRICGDAQCIVDLYVNYDCDLSAANIFERLVNDLSKIAQGRQGIDLVGSNAVQEKAMRVKGIEGLVAILQCMVEWSQSLYVSTNSQSNLGKKTPTLETTDLVSPMWNAEDQSVFYVVKGSERNATANIEQDEQETKKMESEYNPEQFEQRKQQKDIWEHGIEL